MMVLVNLCRRGGFVPVIGNSLDTVSTLKPYHVNCNTASTYCMASVDHLETPLYIIPTIFNQCGINFVLTTCQWLTVQSGWEPKRLKP
jgi:hypothetical protein